MNQTRINRHRSKAGAALTVAASLTFALLAGCGGGGSSGSTTNTSTTPSTLTGTVAVGDALSGANVLVIDANGNNVTTTSDSTGTYSISLTGLTAPLFITATDPNGVNAPMYSVEASITTGTSAAVVANVTTLTTAIAAQLTTDGNPLDLATPSVLSTLVTPATVSASVTKLNTALSSILTANGIASASFDPIGTAFTPNQTGADAVIDAVAVTTTAAGGMQLSSVGNSGTMISLNSSAAVGTPLARPTVQANYLATLLSQLSQCLGGTNSACTSAIDASYLENGSTSFQTEHSGIATAGSVITGVHTLNTYTAGNFPNTNVTLPSALVRILYTSPTGVPSFALTVVQQQSNGNWDIIGNQQQYNVSISTFLMRRQYLNTVPSTNGGNDDATYNRYEAGLNISVPNNAGSSVNPSTLKSASVTGPGLNGLANGTVWLEPRSAVGSTSLSLTNSILTTAPTGGTTTGANTTLYRWSWQALTSSNSTFVPTATERGHYTASTDLMTVAPYSVYTVKFYDTTGTQIGNPVIVINSSSVLTSAAAASVTWQTLGSDYISNFLTPGGSLAAAQSSVSVDWSNLVNNQNLAPLVAGVQIQTSPASGSEVDGWWPGPGSYVSSGQYVETVTSGLSQSGVQQCSPACSFAALAAGNNRNTELYWNMNGTLFYNIWNYDYVAAVQ